MRWVCGRANLSATSVPAARIRPFPTRLVRPSCTDLTVLRPFTTQRTKHTLTFRIHHRKTPDQAEHSSQSRTPTPPQNGKICARRKEHHQIQRKGAAKATPLIRSCSKSSHVVQHSRGIAAPNATAPSYSAEAFTPIVRLSTVRMPTIKMMPTARQIRKFCTKPAITKQTNDTPATVRAYGSCVLT